MGAPPVQAVHFGFQLPSASVPRLVKSRKRSSIDTVDDANLPIYNASNRRGPPSSRRYVEVTSTQILEDAWKKNLLWLLARLHSSENQTIPSLTEINISGLKGYGCGLSPQRHYQRPGDCFYRVPSPEEVASVQRRNLVPPKHCCCVRPSAVRQSCRD